ncbi:MAG: tRNA lysidine(34) synthetase TilS [Gammaproteobacteria bacterium]|nr:tRNA lysidine(34) synthetase TilS [Gammaproteobacteria bacterium]
MKRLVYRLRDSLDQLPATDHYLVAYSGGRDSHVLLHLLAGLATAASRPRISAVHVNHGLQSGAEAWTSHCLTVCNALGIRCHTLRLKLAPSVGESPEAQARDARYQALERLLQPGEILLTAHHQDDQAETLLLQLLRGAGPAGLAAMPLVSRFGCGYLARPLLGVERTVIDRYARSEQLSWIEDPSNRSTQFDRNFLRNQVMPLLRQRWPAAARTIARSARLCAESQALVEQVATETLQHLWSPAQHTLALTALAQLEVPRARAVLRAWIAAEGFPTPGSAKLERLLHEMVNARSDRNPLVHWPGVEVRRFRDRLYIMPPLPALQEAERSLDWDGQSLLQLPAGIGQLTAEQGMRGICLPRWRRGTLQVCFAPRQQSVRIAGRRHSTSFKKLFQHYGVPVWMRLRTPLIYLDNQLAAVGDLCICEPFAAADGEPGIHVRWLR